MTVTTEQVQELLRAGKALIDSPGKWTQHSYARDSNGIPITIGDQRACEFCSTGAVAHVTAQTQHPVDTLDIATKALNTIAHERSQVGIIAYNDRAYTKHADIMSLFDEAIQRAGEFVPKEPDAAEPHKLSDIDLLQRLHDAWGLVKYYETPEGEWGRHGVAGKDARTAFSELLHEANERGLDYMECLQ